MGNALCHFDRESTVKAEESCGVLHPMMAVVGCGWDCLPAMFPNRELDGGAGCGYYVTKTRTPNFYEATWKKPSARALRS